MLFWWMFASFALVLVLIRTFLQIISDVSAHTVQILRGKEMKFRDKWIVEIGRKEMI